MAARTIIRSGRICATCEALATLLATAATAVIPIPSQNGSVPPFRARPSRRTRCRRPPRRATRTWRPTSARTCTTTPTRPTPTAASGPLGARHERVDAVHAPTAARSPSTAQGRIVTVCVGLAGPTLRMLDPNTLDTLAEHAAAAARARARRRNRLHRLRRRRLLLPRRPGPRGHPDDRRATSSSSPRRADARLRARARLRPHAASIADGDKIISRAARLVRAHLVRLAQAASSATSTRRRARSSALDTGEPIGNSFAVDEHGGVYIVTDAALYRFDAGAAARRRSTWREPYDNTGVAKPGQTRDGLGHDADADGPRPTSRSPTTPTR